MQAALSGWIRIRSVLNNIPSRRENVNLKVKIEGHMQSRLGQILKSEASILTALTIILSVCTTIVPLFHRLYVYVRYLAEQCFALF